MIGVFIDTFLVLTMTALVVISTLYAGNGPLAGGAAEGIDQSNMAQLAFSSVFGEGLGSIFVAVCLLFFAFSTILSWNFFGKLNVAYLFGKRATAVYSVLGVVFIFLGSCLSNDLADHENASLSPLIPYFFFLFAAPCLGETLPDRGRHPFDNAIPFSCVPPILPNPLPGACIPPALPL